MKISFNAKRDRPRKDLNDEEKKNGLKHSFLVVTSATLTLKGKTMYMLPKLLAKFSIITPCYKQRLYLLWNSRDPLDIINGTGKVDVTDTFYQNFKKLLTLSQLYDFVKYLN